MLPILLTAAALAAPPDSPGRLNARNLNAHLDQLIPLVEQVAGREFTSRPEVVLAQPGKTRQVLVSELQDTCKRLYPGIDDAQAQDLAFWVGQEDIPYLLGKYGFETNQIYLRPRAVLTNLVERRLPRRHTQDALRLVLVHELAHALQDQVADIGEKFATAPSWEAYRGLNAVTEGHAVAIEQAVATRLGLDEVSVALEEGMGDIYVLGHQFVKARSETPTRHWDVIETPPAHTGQVIHPDTWNDGRQMQPVGHRAWVTAAAALGLGELGAMSQDVGEWNLHLALLPMPWGPRAELGRGVTGGRTWSGRHMNGAWLEVHAWNFQTPEQAASIVAAVNRNKAGIAKQNPWSGEEEFSVVPNLVQDGPVPGLDLPHTRYTVDFQQTYGDSFRKVAVWAAHGTEVVAIQTWWANPTDDQLAAAVSAALGVAD